MTQRFKRLFTVESLIVAAVIFVAIFFAKFPTLYHWLNTPKGYWYPKNTSWFDAWDINTYVSFIRYGERAGVLLENPYTTITHDKEFIYQSYTVPGVLNRLFHLDPFIVFHIAAILTSIVLILVTYYVIKSFIEDKSQRLAVFIMAILGGGFGWVTFIKGADYWNAGFTMVNAFERGHDAASTAFLLLSLLNIYLFTTFKKAKYLIYGILSSLGSIAIHPTFILLYFPVSILALFYHSNNKQRIKSLVYPLSLVLTFLIYYLLFFAPLRISQDFGSLGHITIGNVLRWVNSFSLLSGFGFLSIFIIWCLIFMPNNDRKLSFVKLFFLSQFFFVFFPVDFNLYFLKALYVWGVILALYGLNDLITNKKILNVILTILVVTSLLTRIYIFNNLMNAKVDNSFFYLTKSEGDAISFMSALPQNSSILSLYKVGNYIPAHTDNRVYYGHKYMTPNGEVALQNAQNFYTLLTEEEQRKFLKNNNINFIYYGLEEAQLRKNAKLDIKNPFSTYPIVFQNDSSIIYSTDKQIEKI